MRTTPSYASGLLLLAACVADDPKQDTQTALEVIHIGVDIDIEWVTQPVELYNLVAVVTVSREEVPQNPGGDVIDTETVDACTLNTLDPASSDHPPYSEVEALDVGTSVVLTVGDVRLNLAAVDDTGGRNYVLETTSDTVTLPFPSTVGLELIGDGELPAMTIADVAWIPETFTWTSPPALASGLDPEIAVTEDITLEWAGAPSEDDPGFAVWINNTGSNTSVGEFWEQLSCALTDDGGYTVTAAEQGALQVDDGGSFRTVQLERYTESEAVPLAEGIVGSAYAAQIRRADYVPVVD